METEPVNQDFIRFKENKVIAITKQPHSKSAYTIIELLTVMTIVVILIGMLVPSLNMVKRYARKVNQKAQFHAIDVAMELYNHEFEGYPDSDEEDEAGQDYCGALKLAEAMMGQDLIGFHPDSHFRADCTEDGTSATRLYDNPPGSLEPVPADNLDARKKPFLQLGNANAYRLRNIYGEESGSTDPFDKELFVLCDVYKSVLNMRKPNEGGKPKIGMPILYYKANTSGTKHPYIDERENLVGNIDAPENIYDYKDNDELVKLGMPFKKSVAHLMASGSQPTRLSSPLDISDPKYFYDNTKNDKIQIKTGMPFNSDTYILLSAGYDGEYGTRDDVFNFTD